MDKYRKAIASVIATAGVVASAFGFDLPFLTPEVQAAIVAVIGSMLVYLIPNNSTV